MSEATVKIPDGNGGWTEVQAQTLEGSNQADTAKQAEALTNEWYREVDGLIKHLWRVGKLYQTDNGLTEEQVAFAVALLQVNCRQTYPADKGGPTRFDALHEAAWAYFNEATGG